MVTARVITHTALIAALAAAGLLGSGCTSTTAPRDTRGDTRQFPGVSQAEVRAGDEALLDGLRLRKRGVTSEALEQLERAIAHNPRLTPAYLHAGHIYRENLQFNAAEQRYRQAAELEPENFDAQYYHALSLHLLERLTDAVKGYLRALRIREDDFDANLNLAIAYLQLREPTEARRFAERAVQLGPDIGEARVALGDVYAALERHEAAVIEYQQAAELIELSPELLLSLADSLGRTGRYAEMAATLDQLILIEPSAVAHERLGSALFRLRRYDEALDAFVRATELDPAHYPAWNGVGVCKLNQHLWSDRQDKPALRDALNALRRSLRLYNNQPRIVELVRRYG